MHRHDHIAKGWHFVTRILMATARLTPRRLGVIATLALVLAIGIAGQTQTPRVQAAPAGDASIGIWLYAEQVGGKRTLCVGDVVVIRVSVLKRIGVEGEYMLGRLVGVEVGAFVDGSGVGTISPAKITTTMASDGIGAAYFTFSAKRPGTTTVVLQGKVNTRVLLGLEFGGNTVTAAVPLTVEDCKYKVTAISRWRVPGPANLNMVALISSAGMTEVGGGRYEGIARVEWTITAGQVGDCIPQSVTTSSQAELNGQVFGPEEFIVDVAYLPAMISLPVYCVGSGGGVASGSTPVQMTPDPVTLSVPASGGGDRREQILKGPQPTSGSVVIFVRRATGQ